MKGIAVLVMTWTIPSSGIQGRWRTWPGGSANATATWFRTSSTNFQISPSESPLRCLLPVAEVPTLKRLELLNYTDRDKQRLVESDEFKALLEDWILRSCIRLKLEVSTNGHLNRGTDSWVSYDSASKD